MGGELLIFSPVHQYTLVQHNLQERDIAMLYDFPFVEVVYCSLWGCPAAVSFLGRIACWGGTQAMGLGPGVAGALLQVRYVLQFQRQREVLVM